MILWFANSLWCLAAFKVSHFAGWAWASGMTFGFAIDSYFWSRLKKELGEKR